jgi:stalled ribosome rescue protein Dom34
MSYALIELEVIQQAERDRIIPRISIADSVDELKKHVTTLDNSAMYADRELASKALSGALECLIVHSALLDIDLVENLKMHFKANLKRRKAEGT